MSTRSASPPRPRAAGERGLRLRQRDPGDLHAVLARGVDREAAPAAADVEQPLALLQRELRAHELELRPLRLLEARPAAREERAAVGHRLVEEEREELVREVVVVAHGARRAPGCGGARAGAARRPAPAAGASARPRARRRSARRSCAAPVERRRLPAVEQRQHGVEVVDLERAAHVGAPEAELAGRAQHVARPRRASARETSAPAAVRGGSSVPSQNVEPERALGQGRLELPPQRLGRAQGGHGLASRRPCGPGAPG